MPLNSAEIAQSVGMYQQQYAQQMGYSGMIGGGGMPQVQAESMGSGILNRGMAIGGPVASLAMGMAGVDPISMGMKFAQIGGRMGFGALGAGAMGIGAATGVGAAMAVGGFAANQMYTGMQQQQQFNQSMRQSFNFISPAGQGFTGSQLGQMSQTLRGMADQTGPAGQMVSFGELTKLAAGMGQMGMGQGVRDVQEFGKRFRQMVDTLKTVSKELGTSLEASQQFVSGLRGSGIFNQADQIKAAMSMRTYSASGTIAVSEISAMGNIGSQISRSVGGRGRSGAVAGMKTMGMVGAAIDSGALSEEDIYNATGLTGAEGRQAYATAQLGSAANFLKTGKGRYFLASVAGENGKLDANSVSEWMSGDVGVGRTKGMAGSNLGKVGRANFIRNEGRLRGSALEQFGGMLPAMALMSWAGERGIDVNTMNDREMLFASRQLGIGMDQLEGTVNQVRNMPQMMRQLRMSRDASTYLQNQADTRKTQGIEGAKRAFEHARDKVQNAIQETGANFYTDLVNDIETKINELAGTYVEQASRNLQESYEHAKRGGNSEKILRQLGIGQGAPRAGFTALGGKGTLLGAGAGASYEAFTTRGFGGIGTSDFDRMKDAGYASFFKDAGKEKDPGKRDALIADGIRRAEAFHEAAMGGNDKHGRELGTAMKEELQRAYGHGGVAGTAGMERVNHFQDALRRAADAGNPQAKAALADFKTKSETEKAAYVASAEAASGIPEHLRIGANSAPAALMSSIGGAHSLSQGSRLSGEAVMGRNTSGIGKAIGGWLGLGLGAVLGPGAAATAYGGAWLGNRIEEAARGTHGRAEFAGEFMRSERGQELIANMMSTNKDDQQKAQSFINAEMQSLQHRKERGKEGGLEGQIAMYARLQASKDAMDKAEKLGRSLTEAELDEIAKSHRANDSTLKGSDIQSVASGLSSARLNQEAADRRAAGRMYGLSGREKSRELTKSGVMDAEGKVSASYLADVRKIGGSKAEEAVLASIQTTKLEAGLRGDGSAADSEKFSQIFGGGISQEERNRLRTQIREKGWDSLSQKERESMGSAAQAANGLQGLSIQQQRQLAAAARTAGDSEMAEVAGGLAGQNARNALTLRKGNVGLAGALGLNLSNEEKRRLWNMSGEKGAAAISRALGLSSTEGAKEAREGSDAAKKELSEAEAALSRMGKTDPGRAAAAARVEDAKQKVKDASKVADTSEAGAAVRDKLEAIGKLKGEAKAKALTDLQNDPQAQKFLDEKKREKDEANNPMVKGLSEIAKAVDPLKGVLIQGFQTLTEAVKKKGTGGSDEPSDERLKENIEPLPDPLALLKDLHGYQYTWKGRPEDGKDVGVLAQEVEKVLPEAVIEVDGVKRVYYHKLVPVLLEAVKMLSERVAELEKKEG